MFLHNLNVLTYWQFMVLYGLDDIFHSGEEWNMDNNGAGLS